MKHFAFALLVAFTGITGAAQGAEAPTPLKRDIAVNSAYKMRSSLFDQLTAHRKVVMLGDSLTARGEWAELTGSVAVANRGIGGDTTAGIISRLTPIKAMKPNAVFIMAGINDLKHGSKPDSVVENYKKIIEELHSSGSSIYVQSTLYTNRKNMLKDNESIREINESIGSYCAKTKNCEYIDLNNSLSKSGRLKKEMTLDGIHLNGEGYMAWTKAIRPYLKTVISQ